MPSSSTPSPASDGSHTILHLCCCVSLLVGFLASTCLKAPGCPLIFWAHCFHHIIYLFSQLQWLSDACCIRTILSALFLYLLRLSSAQALAGYGCLPPFPDIHDTLLPSLFNQVMFAHLSPYTCFKLPSLHTYVSAALDLRTLVSSSM